MEENNERISANEKLLEGTRRIHNDRKLLQMNGLQAQSIVGL